METSVMPGLTDGVIEQRVLRAIGVIDDIGSREICVLSRNGVVTLKGTVNSLDIKFAATRAARIASGVVRVVNKLSFKPAR